MRTTPALLQVCEQILDKRELFGYSHGMDNTENTTPTVVRLYGWTIWPILTDDETLDYYDIYEPCDRHDPRRRCDCAANESQGLYTAATLRDAKAIIAKATPGKWQTTMSTHTLHRIANGAA